MGLSDFVKKATTVVEKGVDQVADSLSVHPGSESADRHRYGSSFAPTAGNQLKWFIDGKDYFHALSEALEQATSTIAIIGWWVTPELFLRRPPSANHDWRLDRILGRAAARGVKVYGVVYDDVALVATMDSEHTVTALEKVNKDMIRIMRHPDHDFFKDPLKIQDALFWSHHDKAVIIDDKTVVWGGLDSCFGRWDYNAHPLADLHAHIRDELWVGQDYNNARIMDFSHVENWKYNMLKRTESPRMPWHDVSMSATGPLVHSFTAHFIQRWNFVKKDKYEFNEHYPILPPAFGNYGGGGDDPVSRLGRHLGHQLHLRPTPGDTNQGVYAQLCRSATKWSQGIPHEMSIQNAYIDLISHANLTATGDKQSPVKNQIGRALVERILRAARGGEKFKVVVLMPAVPGFAANIKNGQEVAGTKAIMDYQYKSICRGGHSIMETIACQGFDPHEYITFFNLRSFDRIALTQQLIDQEQKSGIDTVKADIALDLDLNGVDRIKDGNVTVSSLANGDSLDAATHHFVNNSKNHKDRKLGDLFSWNEKTSTDGKYKEVNQVLSDYEGAITPSGVSDSVAEHGMMTGKNVYDQTWGGDSKEAVENFVTEELYIHTKLMIIDDRYVIVGSANLNDRSQLGDRDSEVAVVIEDPPVRQAYMNGQPWKVSPFAASLRRRLCREHLGLLHPDEPNHITANSHPLPAGNEYDWDSKEDIMVADPLSPQFAQLLGATAQKNTEIFRNIFHSVPDDTILTTADYDKFVTQTKVGHVADYNMPLDYVVSLLSAVRGHIVSMPLHYMEHEHLIAPGLNLEVNPLTDDVYT